MRFSRRKFTLTRLFVRQHIHLPSQQVKNAWGNPENIGERSEIVGIFKETHNRRKRIRRRAGDLALLKRRAWTVDQMTFSLEMKEEEIAGSLDQLLQGKCIRSYIFNGKNIFKQCNYPAAYSNNKLQPRMCIAISAEKIETPASAMGYRSELSGRERLNLR